MVEYAVSVVIATVAGVDIRGLTILVDFRKVSHLVRVAVGCGDASLGGIVCVVDTEVGALTFCAHSVFYSSDRKD